MSYDLQYTPIRSQLRVLQEGGAERERMGSVYVYAICFFCFVLPVSVLRGSGEGSG